MVFPIASFLIGANWLRDTHWDATFANLGDEIFDARREAADAQLERWERTLRSQLRGPPSRTVVRTDEGVIRAVALLSGMRRSAVAERKILGLTDSLLKRAVGRQIAAMNDAPFDRALITTWRRTRDRSERFVLRLGLRTFAAAWARHTIIQLGLISAGALFLGAFIGLVWWVARALLSDPASPLPVDWTAIAGGVVTFVTVVAVAAVLTWRLARAVLMIYPTPATWAGRALVAAAVIALLFISVELTFDLTRFDPELWMEENGLPARTASTVLVLIVLVAASAGSVVFAVRRRRRSGATKTLSGRVLAAASALFILPATIAIAFTLVGGTGIPPFPLPQLVMGSVIGSFGLMLAAVVLFVREMFSSWRDLQVEGIVIRRFGFREWQVWVTMGLLVVPLCASLLAEQLWPSTETEPSAVALLVGMPALLFVPGSVVTAALGTVFGVRLMLAHDAARATETGATGPERIVSPERMRHYAMVTRPLGSFVFGPDSFIVPSPHRDGISVLGVARELEGVRIRMPGTPLRDGVRVDPGAVFAETESTARASERIGDRAVEVRRSPSRFGWVVVATVCAAAVFAARERMRAARND